MVYGWMSGRVRTAKPEHLSYVLGEWPRIAPRITLTPEISAALKSEFKRTGVSYPFVQKSLQADVPKLSTTNLSRWARGQSKTACKKEVEAVLALLRSLPNAEFAPESPAHRYITVRDLDTRPGDDKSAKHRYISARELNTSIAGDNPAKHQYITNKDAARIPLTAAMLTALNREHARTGIGPTALLRTAASPPERLTTGEISSWLNVRPATVNEAHYRWVIEAWSALASKPK